MLGDAGRTLSTEILLIQGRLRYITDWDHEITDRLKSRAMPPTPPIVTRRHAHTGERVEHRLVLTQVPAGHIRRFDYGGCKARASALYHRHVSVNAPLSPLTLTFAKAGVWDQIKSEGWLSFAQAYAARRAVQPAWSYGHQASVLNEVRLIRAALEAAEQIKRIALAELIVERDIQPRAYTYEGGILRVRPSKPHQRIKLDFAEQHAQLREFIKYSARKAFTKVEFRPLGVDLEGDDEDEEAMGIWTL